MIDFLRKRSRRIIANTLYYSGALWLMAYRRFRRKTFVLMYHRVLPAGADSFSADSICVTPEAFERQMKFLRRHFRVLSIAELADHLESGRELPSGSCVVTFDDGWRDNFEHALPILREQQVPAVIFVATDFIGGNDCFWQERLSRLLFDGVRGGADARALVAEIAGSALLADSDEAGQRRAIREAVDRLKTLPPAQIERIEARVRDVVSTRGSLGDDRFMDWQQVASLVKGTRVEVGAHGCSHTPLTKLSPERAALELDEAARRVSAAVGVPTTSIGYPNGNYDDVVVKLTRAAGYRLGFTTDKGLVGDVRDPFKIPRINIGGPATETMPDFLCAILQVFHRLRRSQPGSVDAHPRHG
jgi:peptidoglycan/xylan/chitin deacetylase (PgdA/CDA1 family)